MAGDKPWLANVVRDENHRSENMRSVIIAVGLACALGLSLCACNKGGAQQQAATAPTTAANGAAGQAGAPAGLDGAGIYAKASCGSCHGDDRGGTPVAPRLLTLKQNWTVNQLVQYLIDPAGFISNDSRLMAQSQKFTTKMPTPEIGKEERYTLAKWLLGQ
jgi:cytochrome c553